MGRRVLAILVAAVLALLGAVLVFMYARNADNRAVAGQEPRAVYVSTALVPSGTTLKDALRTKLIEATQVAAKAEPAGALETIDSTNESLVAVADVAPGQYLLVAGFGKTAVGAKAITVPDGMLAISVSLSDPARVGNFVTPGSHIAIFETAKLKKFGTDDASKQFNDLDIHGTGVLLPDTLVIGMGNATQNPAPQPTATANAQTQSGGASFLVTVAVTPQDSVRLVHAINSYVLYAGLRGGDVNMPPGLESDDTKPFGK